MTARTFDLEREPFIRYAASIREAARVQRYPTFRTLERYLDQSGGSVGRMMVSVLGVTHPQAVEYAVEAGKAIALLWCAKRLATDYTQGVIRLPLQDFAESRYTERDLAAGSANDALRRLLDIQMARIEAWVDSARGILRALAGDRERVATAWLLCHVAQQVKRMRK